MVEVVAPACGDGTLDAGEGCDDGGVLPGDGCDAACLVETGSACNAAAPGLIGAPGCAIGSCDLTGGAPGVCGVPVVAAACGDGTLDAGEGCDDGNLLPGDGCDAACLVETGFSCSVTPNTLSFTITDAVDFPGNFPDPAETADGIINNLGGAGANGVTYDTTAATGQPNPTFEYMLTVSGSSVVTGFDMYGVVGGAIAEQLKAYELTILSGGAVVFTGTASTPTALPNGTPLSLSGFSLAAGTYQVELQDLDTPLINREFSEIGFTGSSPSICVPVGPACGNGILEAGEGCDDGNTNNVDACDNTCLVRTGNFCNVNPAGLTGSSGCASGICDATSGAPGFCQRANACGNSVLETGEGCDDGNTLPGDGCDAACLVETGSACNAAAPGLIGAPGCAVGSCDLTGGAPGVCGVPAPACGDGTLDAGEGCDDGNLLAGDGCDATCLVETGSACNAAAPGLIGAPSCAIGSCDLTGGAPGVCGVPVATPACGDGTLDAGEGCDDGNLLPGDGCDAACLVETGSACNAAAPGLIGAPGCAIGSCDLTGGAPGVCGVPVAAPACGDGTLAVSYTHLTLPTICSV